MSNKLRKKAICHSSRRCNIEFGWIPYFRVRRAGGARRDRSVKDEEIAETRFAEQRNQIRLEVESSFFSLGANKDNIVTATKAVDLAAESLRLARLRFQAGVGTQLDVINAQTELTTARSNLLTAVINYNQDLARLERAVSNLPNQQLFRQPWCYIKSG